MNINVKFIWHDCFLVTLPECVIVSDYWVDAPNGVPAATDLPKFLEDISPDMPLYVLVSHHHKDHFTKSIFKWASKFSRVHYIISKDTARFIKYLLNPNSTYSGAYSIDINSVTVLKPGMEFADDILTVQAYGSTDIGNSYLIEYKGYKFFHAGDLNAWIWKDESTEQEINKALGDYKVIINSIKGCNPDINVVFFPVDSRIGSEYWTGAKIFLNEINIEYFIPMHFCLYDTQEQFEKRKFDASRTKLYKPDKDTIFPRLTEPYESIELNLNRSF